MHIIFLQSVFERTNCLERVLYIINAGFHAILIYIKHPHKKDWLELMIIVLKMINIENKYLHGESRRNLHISSILILKTVYWFYFWTERNRNMYLPKIENIGNHTIIQCPERSSHVLRSSLFRCQRTSWCVIRGLFYRCKFKT